MRIKQNIPKKPFFLLILSLIFFILSYIVSYYDNTNFNFSQISDKLNSNLKIEEKKSSDLIDKVIESLIKNNSVNFFKDETLLNISNEDLLVRVYSGDSLIYWNDNSVDISVNSIKSLKQNKLLQLGNGWYDCSKKTIGKYSIIGMILIKYEFPYQNEYLKNRLNKHFNLPSAIDISKERGEYNIYSHNGNFLFSLRFNSFSDDFHSYKAIINLFNLVGIFFLIVSILLAIKVLVKKKIFYILLSSLALIILRILCFYYKVPHSFFNLELFSPAYYANSELIPSLGDLLLYAILVVLISVLIYKNSNIPLCRSSIKNKVFYVISFFSTLFLFILSWCFIYIVRSIIINSDIILYFSNIFNLSIYSYISIFIISTFLFSYFIICLLIIRNILVHLSVKEIISILFIVISAFILLFFFHSYNYIYNLIPLSTVMVFWYLLQKHTYRSSRFKLLICFLLIFSTSVTFLLNRYNGIKEKERRKLLAFKLAEDREPAAEFLFQTVKDKIKSDNIVLANMNKISDDRVEFETKKYLLSKYFTGFWSKYNVQITICESNDSLIVKPENVNTNCRDFFNNMINLTCKPALTDDLYYRFSESVTNSYIGVLSFSKDISAKHSDINMFIELDSKFIPKELGYPKLLIDKRLDIADDFSNYAYAKYKNEELIYQYGKYFYRSSLFDFKNFKKEFSFVIKNKYNHLVYKPDGSTVFIISKDNDDFIRIISPFSYLIIFFILYFSFFIFLLESPFDLHRSVISLQLRIVYTFIIIIIGSFIGIGFLSVNYINKSNEEKNSDNLSEKTHSILIEIQNKLSETEMITPSMYENVSGILQNLANVFFTDINLYNENGRLIASSRPKVYEEGLQSRNMNPFACKRMLFDYKTFFIQKENIGNLSYYSSYMPVRNMNNKTIAYVNLSYFAKQSEYKNQISAFLTTFINTYIIILAVAIILVLLISNYITQPLKLIRDKISKIKLGKINEKIDWSRNDELGNLVAEYNNMIDELARSAEILAKSERESAWREMAKQVAHEIKNPLTPMKLSIQHLQKVFSENLTGSDLNIKSFTSYKEKLDKISITMIEQIDMLSEIASQFSDFANLPYTNNAKVDLNKVINNTVELYKNAVNLSINFSKPDREYNVFADYKQLLRVFNNLIKNSVQAIEHKPDGRIDIKIEENVTVSQYLITIKDNGRGISSEDFIKIFSPNFTTKTAGTGLGLPIAKSIIESAGGTIRFESILNSGTTFFITLPFYSK